MNDAGPGAASVRRGLILKEQRRYDEAEKFFREALAQNPNDAEALMHLASCQMHMPGREREALQTIDQAIAIEPNESTFHGLRALILCDLRKPADALKSADTAVGLEPTSTFAFTARTHALLHLEKWNDAEQSARMALMLDPDNSGAANQLAQALRLQNKMDENADRIASMLSRDPDDSSTHNSAGWAALQRGKHREAEKHFMEALRLNPKSESSRDGLLNSFRARSPLYRGYLQYCFWMQRIGRNQRIAVIIGLLFISRISRQVFTGQWAVVGYAITAIYMLLVLWSWVAKGVGNFILLFDRFAKYALHTREKIEAVAVGGSVVVGIALLITSLAIDREGLHFAAIALIASAFPFALTFTNESKVGTFLFGAIGATAFAAFAGLLVHSLVFSGEPADFLMGLFSFGVMGAVITTWIAGIPALRRGN